MFPPLGPSSESLLCSTSCIAAVPVSALVIEAIQQTVSLVFATSLSAPRVPAVAEQISPSEPTIVATAPDDIAVGNAPVENPLNCVCECHERLLVRSQTWRCRCRAAQRARRYFDAPDRVTPT